MLFSLSVSQRICLRSGPACSSRSGHTQTVLPDWLRLARRVAASRHRPLDCCRALCQLHHLPCPSHRHTWTRVRKRRSMTQHTHGRTWACWSHTCASPPACEFQPPVDPPGLRIRVCPEPSHYRRCTPYRLSVCRPLSSGESHHRLLLLLWLSSTPIGEY